MGRAHCFHDNTLLCDLGTLCVVGHLKTHLFIKIFRLLYRSFVSLKYIYIYIYIYIGSGFSSYLLLSCFLFRLGCQ